MYPAYLNNKWSLVYFVSFIIVAVFVVVNLLTAVIYEAYASEYRIQVRRVLVSPLSLWKIYRFDPF